MRLRHDTQYQRVYGARMRKARGALAAFAAPNELPHYRLGLAVGKSVGNSVERHRAKRLLREAFRLSQHELPRGPDGGYDLILSARGKQALTLDSARALVVELAVLLHREWDRRRGRAGA